MKRYSLALLLALISFSTLDAKEEKRKKDPTDVFDIENIRNGEWVALEQEPQSSNIYNAQDIGDALKGFVSNSQEDLPSSSFTLRSPGFQRPKLSVLHSPPTASNSNEKPSELELIYNEFVRQKLKAIPLSANTNKENLNFREEFGDFLSQNPQGALHLLNAIQHQPEKNNPNDNKYQQLSASQQTNDQNIFPFKQTQPQINNFLNPQQETPSAMTRVVKAAYTQPPVNPSNFKTQQYTSNFNTQQDPSNYNTQQTQGNFNTQQNPLKFNPAVTLSSGVMSSKSNHIQQSNPVVQQNIPTIHPVIPLADFLSFVRLQNDVQQQQTTKDTKESERDDDISFDAKEENITKHDPHDDKSYLLTDNDEFKIARDPNGNAILLSMVSNNGEWPAVSSHYAGTGHGIEHATGHTTEYSTLSANNNEHFTSLPLSYNSKLYQNSSSDLTSVQNYQYNTAAPYDINHRPGKNTDDIKFHTQDSFLGGRPSTTEGYSPTRDPYQLTQNLNNYDTTTVNGQFKRQNQAYLLSNEPSSITTQSNSNYNDKTSVNPPDYTTQPIFLEQSNRNVPSSQNHFFSKRPSTFASSFPSTSVSGQKGQTEGSISPAFLTTHSFGTSHDLYTPPQDDASIENKNVYSPLSASSYEPHSFTKEYSNDFQVSKTTPTPIHNSEFITSSDYPTKFTSYSSNEKTTRPLKSEIYTTKYQISPLSLEFDSLLRQESTTNPELRSTPPISQTTTSGSSFPQQTTVPLSTYTTLQSIPPTTVSPSTTANFRETTLTDYPSHITSSDEEEGNLPPYNPYPNRPLPSNIQNKPQYTYPSSQPSYGSYLSNSQSRNPYSSHLSNPSVSYNAPPMNNRPSKNSHYSHKGNVPQFSYPNFQSRQPSQMSSSPQKYREPSSYQTLSNDVPGYNYRPQSGNIESIRPSSNKNSWLTNNYLAKPYYVPEQDVKPEMDNTQLKPSYRPPASSYHYVQSSYGVKPESVQYNSQLYAGSYPSFSQQSGPYQYSHGNYHAIQGSATSSQVTVMTPQLPSTTPSTTTPSESLPARNAWKIPKLPLQSKQDTDIEESLPIAKPATTEVDRQDNPSFGHSSSQQTGLYQYPQGNYQAIQGGATHSNNQQYQIQNNYESYPESSFIPSNGPAALAYPPYKDNNIPHPKPPKSSSSQLSSYPSPLSPQDNPGNSLQDDPATHENTLEKYTDEELEPVYLPADNCSTTFVVREDRQSVLGVRAMPGGAAECALTFLAPRPDRRLALQLLGINMPEGENTADCDNAAVSVFSQLDGRNLLVREFCGQVPTSPALLTEGHSALVTVRAKPGSQRAGFTILAFLW